MKPAKAKNRTHSLSVSNRGPYMAAWYKWEFLRRNSEYRADYQGFMNSFGAWFKRKGFWYDQARRIRWTKSDQEYFRTKIEPRIIRLCQKWQIFDLFPPEKGLAEAYEITKSGDRGLYPPTGIPPESMRDFRFAGRSNDLAFVGKSVSAKRNGSCLSVEFNLNWRMKDLMHYAKRVIKFAQRGYRDELHEGGLKPPKGQFRSNFVFDTMAEWANWDPRSYPSLDLLARSLNVGEKSGTGDQVLGLWNNEKYAALANYCLQDCWLTFGCYCRMNFQNLPPRVDVPEEVRILE